MSRRLGTAGCTAAIVAFAAAGCSAQEQSLAKHHSQVRSLESTTRAIVEGYASGDLPPTYTKAALEQTFRLIEHERQAIASSPESLLEPRRVSLVDSSERLSRVIATLWKDVSAGDRRSAAAHVAAIDARDAPR